MKAMKTADPRVKVGVIGVWDETSFPQRFTVTNPRTGIATNGWSAVLLSQLASLGVTPDYYEIHNYPQSNGTEDDSALLQSHVRLGADHRRHAANAQRLSRHERSDGAHFDHGKQRRFHQSRQTKHQSRQRVVHGRFMGAGDAGGG